MPDNCSYCDNPQTHVISPLDAAVFIQNFLNAFPRVLTHHPDFIGVYTGTYGGTIYTSMPVPVAMTAPAYSALKFHYCMDAYQNVYIAFENDGCDSAMNRVTPGVRGSCIAASTINHFNGLPPTTAASLSAHMLAPPALTFDSPGRAKVVGAKTKFSTTPPFNIVMQLCTDHEGYYNWNLSIGDIMNEMSYAGFRYYFGWNARSDNPFRVILVGVDVNGKNLTRFRENSDPTFIPPLTKQSNF